MANAVRRKSRPAAARPGGFDLHQRGASAGVVTASCKQQEANMPLDPLAVAGIVIVVFAIFAGTLAYTSWYSKH